MKNYLLLIAVIACALCISDARADSQIEVQFEDVPASTQYPNSALPTTFVTEGVSVTLTDATGGGYANASIGSSNIAGGTGNELEIWAYAKAELDLGPGYSSGFFQYADLGISFEQVRLMGRSLDIRGQVMTGLMALHVHPLAPHFAVGQIVDLAFIGYVNRLAVFAVKLFQLIRVEFFHKPQSPKLTALTF